MTKLVKCDMNELFGTVIYTLYDIFFKQLTQEDLNKVMTCTKGMDVLLKSCGGICKRISYDYKLQYSDFITRLSENDRIEIVKYDGQNTNANVFDMIPINSKVLVLKNVHSKNLTPISINDKLEYLFLEDSPRSSTFTMMSRDFPNLKFIGCKRCDVVIDDKIPPFLRGVSTKRPHVIRFPGTWWYDMVTFGSLSQIETISKNLIKIWG